MLCLRWAALLGLGVLLQLATGSTGVPEVAAAAAGFTSDGGAAAVGGVAQELLRLQAYAALGGAWFSYGLYTASS